MAGVDVSCEEATKLHEYYELLHRWNRRMNLTAIPLDGYTTEALDRLLLEPLVAGKILGRPTGDWVDLGSGGGSPAIPLKIVNPSLTLLMTESRERKAAFLREVVRQLDLGRASVMSGRFETLPSRLDGSIDVVTVRAVRVDQALRDLVSRILRPGGRVLVFGFGAEKAWSGFRLTDEGPLPGTGSNFGLLFKS